MPGEEDAKIDALELAVDALCVVLHRITGTLAEDWRAPNPQANMTCAMAQYPGGLADFIFATLAEIQRMQCPSAPAAQGINPICRLPM